MSDVSNEWLAGVRAIHFAATLSTAGAICFWWAVAAPVFRRAAAAPLSVIACLRRWLDRIVWIGLATFFLSVLAWVVLLAADVSGRPLSAMFTTDAVPALLGSTRFGNVMLIRLLFAGLLAAAFAAAVRHQSPSRRLVAIQLLSAVGLVGALAWVGHGGATEGPRGYLHLLADVLHLCAAAAWLGGLLPLALLLHAARDEPTEVTMLLSSETAQRFSVLGFLSVGTLVATGVVNTWFLAGTVPALVGTTYGKLLLAKIVLFVAMLCLATVNRLHLTPRLSNPPDAPIHALRALRRNSLIELGLGISIVFIVGALGTISPGAHTQPWWPFSFRFDGSVFTHPTALYRTQAVFSALAAGAGILCLAVALPLRAARLPLLFVGALGLSFVPQLVRLVSVEAYPPSFYISPTGYTVTSIARGKELFGEHCAVCHGPDGRGGIAVAKDGPRASDLTGDHVYAHRDGDLFWWISDGIKDAMPGFAGSIGEEEGWNLIDFLHANADAAYVTRFGAADALSVPVPDFSCEEPSGSTLSIGQLRGRLIYILFARSNERARELASADLGADTVKVLVPLNPAVADGSLCIAREPAVFEIFAAYRGGQANGLDDIVFIVDGAGFLRAMQRSSLPPPATLIREIRSRPALPRSTIAAHAH